MESQRDHAGARSGQARHSIIQFARRQAVPVKATATLMGATQASPANHSLLLPGPVSARPTMKLWGEQCPESRSRAGMNASRRPIAVRLSTLRTFAFAAPHGSNQTPSFRCKAHWPVSLVPLSDAIDCRLTGFPGRTGFRGTYRESAVFWRILRSTNSAGLTGAKPISQIRRPLSISS